MYYQKIGLKNWEYRPEKYPNNQNKFRFIQSYAIYDIGFIQTPEQLGINQPYPTEYVDGDGYVWSQVIAPIPGNINHPFSPLGSRGLSRDHIDYTFRPKPFMEGRLTVNDPTDIGTFNGPIFYPNYFHNVR